MKLVMKCVIILHNMVVEERLFIAPVDVEKFSKVIVVHTNQPPMCAHVEVVGSHVGDHIG